jgi:hypothetical protein
MCLLCAGQCLTPVARAVTVLGAVCLALLQVVEVQNATAAYVQLLIETLAARGKYLWQAFAGCVVSADVISSFRRPATASHLLSATTIALVLALVSLATPQHCSWSWGLSNPGESGVLVQLLYP